MSKLSTVSKMKLSQIAGHSIGKVFGVPIEHAFYNRVLNLPSPFWSPRHPWQKLSAEQGNEMIRSMSDDGLVAFPNFLTAEEVAIMKDAIDQQIEMAAAGQATDWEYRPQEDFWCSLNVLNINLDAATKVLDPDLLNIVEGYLKRSAFLSETDSRRLTPVDLATKEAENEKFAMGYSASHWHYDNRGRQVKVQIYLTDVTPESGQNFAL